MKTASILDKTDQQARAAVDFIPDETTAPGWPEATFIPGLRVDNPLPGDERDIHLLVAHLTLLHVQR